MLKLLYILLMFNPTTVTSRLAGLVGFRQPFNPAYQLLNPAIQKSRSGLYITDNPFCKIETIKDSMDFGNAVTEGQFNDFLSNKVNTAIVDVCSAVFSENDFIDNQVIFKNALNKYSAEPTGYLDPQGRNVNIYPMPQGFNCYWIKPSKTKDVAFVISRVMMEFYGTGTITLYLYNTANLTQPLYSQAVEITSPFQEVILLDNNGDPNGWVCDNSQFGRGYKGDYYLGYFGQGQALMPFQRNYRESLILSQIKEMPYDRCNFAEFTDPTKSFDLVNFAPYSNYNGVNPDITLYEDFTNEISRNEKAFARAIQISCQMNLISESLASVRSNRNERISEATASKMVIELEGSEEPVKVTGLQKKFYGAIASLKKEMKKLQVGYQGEGQIQISTIS